MKLYLLRPKVDLEKAADPWAPWYDKAFGFVVRAESEMDARKLANENGGDEIGREYDDSQIDVWLDPEYSTCVLLLANDGEAEVIIRDFAAA